MRTTALQPPTRRAAALVLAGALALAPALQAADISATSATPATPVLAGISVVAPLVLLYSERPPFMRRENDDRVTGLAVDAALRAFAKAEIAVTLRAASPARRLLEVKENKSPICSLGFYATDARRKFARISKPVSQDGPMVAVTSATSEPGDGVKLETFLANPELKVLVKDAIVYGPYMEAQFARMQAQKVSTHNEYAQLLTLVRAQRAHVLFMPQEEASHYLQTEPELARALRVTRFASIPAGETRHVVCSQQVSEFTMARLDSALGADSKLARLK